MTPEQKKRLSDFYNRLAIRPLAPDDPYYEPFLKEAVGEGDPIAKLATGISWSKAASVSLLSGQRGSGKSTELRRLKADLEAEGCVVFLCDMRDYMNLTQPIESTVGPAKAGITASLKDDPDFKKLRKDVDAIAKKPSSPQHAAHRQRRSAMAGANSQKPGARVEHQ